MPIPFWETNEGHECMFKLLETLERIATALEKNNDEIRKLYIVLNKRDMVSNKKEKE